MTATISISNPDRARQRMRSVFVCKHSSSYVNGQLPIVCFIQKRLLIRKGLPHS